MSGPFAHLSWPLLIGGFLLAAVVIGVAGTALARIADELADRTGIGEALTGALFLGATTSLPGLVTSVTAAWHGLPQMAVSNAVGGIAAQTAFLGIADVFTRRSNLEHGAASLANLMQAGVLMALLSIVLAASAVPQLAIGTIHPASILMVALYCYGLHLASEAHARPMWNPRRTPVTQIDEPGAGMATSSTTAALWSHFVVLGALCAVGGWVVARAGIAMVHRSALSASVVGGLFTAITSSLPELVTSVAAVRRGALTLAVGGIIGGNAFDTLFIAVSDVAYRDGTIYSSVHGTSMFVVAVSILMTAILTMGLIRREKHGIANIGFESFAILVLYAGTVTVLATVHEG